MGRDEELEKGIGPTIASFLGSSAVTSVSVAEIADSGYCSASNLKGSRSSERSVGD